ncbi:MAG: hypothetical protein U0174_01540 [Polyangiaceae bacterium]
MEGETKNERNAAYPEQRSLRPAPLRPPPSAAVEARRTPIIGAKLVDEKGVAVVDAWIRGLSECTP